MFKAVQLSWQVETKIKFSLAQMQLRQDKTKIVKLIQ